MAIESPPPLPQEEQPPLPSSGPVASADAPHASGTALSAKQREYRAEPVRSATPPAAAEASIEPPEAAPPAEENKKRKAKKALAASSKRRTAVKVGSLAPAVLDKWAAARKDLVSSPDTSSFETPFSTQQRGAWGCGRCRTPCLPRPQGVWPQTIGLSLVHHTPNLATSWA